MINEPNEIVRVKGYKNPVEKKSVLARQHTPGLEY